MEQTQRTLALNPEQQQLLREADAQLALAQREMNLVFRAICAGEGIRDAALVSLEGATLTVELLEPA
jgi:hypothetical protein